MKRVPCAYPRSWYCYRGRRAQVNIGSVFTQISGVRVLSIRPPDLNRLPVVIVAFFIVVFLVAFPC